MAHVCSRAKAWVFDEAAIANEALPVVAARDLSCRVLGGRVPSGPVDLAGGGSTEGLLGIVGPLEVYRCWGVKGISITILPLPYQPLSPASTIVPNNFTRKHHL